MLSWEHNLSGRAGLHEKVTGEERSQGGGREGLLVALGRQRGQQENAGYVQGQQGGLFGFH